MVSIVIFLAAVSCIVVFLLGTICKALVSAFYGLLNAGANALLIAAIVAAGELVLLFVYWFARAIRTGSLKDDLIATFWSIILIVVFVVILLAFTAFLGSIGEGLGMIIYYIVVGGIVILIEGLERGAELCETANTKLLQAIVKRLDRC